MGAPTAGRNPRPGPSRPDTERTVSYDRCVRRAVHPMLWVYLILCRELLTFAEIVKENKTGIERTRPPGSFRSNLRIVNDLPSRIAVRQTMEGADMACSLWDFPSSVRSVLHRAAAGCCRFAAALASDRRGMSAVEFGVAAPIFLAILMPVVDLGRAYSQQIQIRQAVQAGALYASVDVYTSGTWSSNVSSAITNSTYLSVTPTVSAESCGCPNGTSSVKHATGEARGP